MSRPAVQGDGPGWPRRRLSSQRRSAVRQTVASSGASRRASKRTRQSKDWRLARLHHSFRPKHRDHRAGERLRPRRLLRRERVQLGLDVEAQPLRPRPPPEGQHVGEGRDAGAVVRDLFREPLRGPAARRGPSDVEIGEIGEVQRVEERPGRRQPRAGRVPGVLRVERPVVVHDGDPVAGHAKVELQHVGPELDGPLERRERVLGEQPPGAPVPLDLDAPRRHREPEQGKEREAPKDPPRNSARLRQLGGRRRRRRGGRVPARGRGEGCPRPRPASRPRPGPSWPAPRGRPRAVRAPGCPRRAPPRRRPRAPATPTPGRRDRGARGGCRR